MLTRFFGFIFRIYLSRELGAEMLGVYQVAFSVFMVLVVIVSSGIPLAVSKLTASYRVTKDIKAENSLTTSALIIGLVVSIVLCVVILIFQDFISGLFTDERCMAILITLLPSVIASAVYSAFRGSLWGTQSYFSVSWTELAEQVLRIIAFVIMANWLFTSLDGASIAGLSMSIACVLSATLVIIVYLKSGKRLGNPRNYFKPIFKSATPVTGVRVTSSLIQPVIAVLFPAMLVLAGYTNEQAMESYGMAMGMTFPLLFLPSTVVGALSFTLIPDLSTAIAKKDYTLIQNRIVSCLAFSLFISAAVIPFYMGVGEPIGEFLYANSTSGTYLARAAWIMIPLGLSNITSSILNAFNLEVKSFINNILGGVILLGVVTLGSGFLGVDSLIWGFGGCMIVTTLLNILMLKRHLKIKLGLVKPLVLMTIFIIPTTLIAKWAYPLLMYVFPQFVTIALCAILSCGSFALLCWMFKLIDITSVLVKIKPKKHKKLA